MDGHRFDQWTRSLSTFLSRRTLGKLLTGGSLGALLASFGDEAGAAKCVKPGKRCKSKKGKKKCCGGAKCRGKRCKCPAGREACGKRCCAIGATCQGGTCQPCDVCPSGCAFTTVQAAVDAATAGDTVRVCPGTYTVTDDVGNVINKNLTLIGAGAGNTVLNGGGAARVLIAGAGRTIAVRELTITGGRNPLGGGIVNQVQATLVLEGVSVTGNVAEGAGGGIYNSGSLVLTASTVTSNSAEVAGGGIFNNAGTVALLAGSSVTGNTPDNCAPPDSVSGCVG